MPSRNRLGGNPSVKLLTHCEATTVAFLIFSTNAFDLFGSLRFTTDFYMYTTL